MMKWFGKKKTASSVVSKDLNTLIFDVAEHGLASDVRAVYEYLPQIELFTPITSANFEIRDGEKVRITKGQELSLPMVELQGQSVLFFFIAKNDPRLGQHFASFSVAEAFDLIEKTSHLAGLIFYNDAESFFGLRREDFPELRLRYLK